MSRKCAATGSTKPWERLGPDGGKRANRLDNNQKQNNGNQKITESRPQNKRGLLLEIGLIIALGGVIAAFAWTPKEQKIEKLDLNIAPVEEEIMEITRQEQKPPESPRRRRSP